MGKIKVLFAAENGDDDLYTKEEIKEFLEAKKEREQEMEDVWEKLKMHIDDCKAIIVRELVEVILDEPSLETDMKKLFDKFCYDTGVHLVDTLCETYMLQLTDKEYYDLISKTSNFLHVNLKDKIKIVELS